jgi:phytoene dehydrogenase-like protein
MSTILHHGPLLHHLSRRLQSHHYLSTHQSIRHLTTKHYDVAIVGGGHNSLVSACYLSKFNKRVIVLERAPQFGGATQSVYAFQGINARLSRYSYLVALFPDRIKRELDLEFETLRRRVSWYAPHEDGRGVLLNRSFDDESRKSVEEFAGEKEVVAWETFYERIGKVAEVLAPTLLEPLKSEEEVRSLIGEEAWTDFVEQPLSVTLDSYFTNDLIKGVVLTDGLIGTFAGANDKLANICFLYHLIGNGCGEWRVPTGGMGALVDVGRAEALGAKLKTDSEVMSVDVSDTGISLTTSAGEEISAELLLSGAAPAVLEKLTGIPSAIPCRDGSQVKMNMVLKRLPKLKSGIDPNLAFAGTFHISEGYNQLERAYAEAMCGKIPKEIPAEIYCHTLTDPSILDDSMIEAGNHTLTLFALHTPAFLFDEDSTEKKEVVTKRILDGLNQYLVEPIETLILKDSNGKPCLEVKTPQDLEKEIGLPLGNIFHGNLSWPWQNGEEQRRWGVETAHDRVFIAGAGALRGGGVSGIGGHNAAMAALERLER